MTTAQSKKTSRKTSSVIAVAQVGEATLEKIVEATLDETQGFLYTSSVVHIPLIEGGLVEINPEIKNHLGEIATRATEKGVLAVSKNQEATAVEVHAPASKNGFVLEADIPVPTAKRGGRGGEVYPFEIMTVGQSFFVAS